MAPPVWGFFPAAFVRIARAVEERNLSLSDAGLALLAGLAIFLSFCFFIDSGHEYNTRQGRAPVGALRRRPARGVFFLVIKLKTPARGPRRRAPLPQQIISHSGLGI